MFQMLIEAFTFTTIKVTNSLREQLFFYFEFKLRKLKN